MVVSNKKVDYNDGTIGLGLYLSGFQIQQIIVRVHPKMTLKAFVETIVDKFNLEQVDSCGFVGYHVLSMGYRPSEILKYYDNDGNTLTFEDQGIGDGEDLCLFYAPGGSTIYTVPYDGTERSYDDSERRSVGFWDRIKNKLKAK